MRDRSRRPEGVVNGSRSKIFQNLNRRPLSQNHRKPSNLGQREDPGRSAEAKARETSQIAAQHTQTSQTGALDRSDRSGWNSKIQTGQTGIRDRSDRSLPDSPRPKLQKANLEQTNSKSSETWRIPSHWSREHVSKRSHPKD